SGKERGLQSAACCQLVKVPKSQRAYGAANTVILDVSRAGGGISALGFGGVLRNKFRAPGPLVAMPLSDGCGDFLLRAGYGTGSPDPG
ncbi:MAG: hypothetical protein ACO1TE_29470, partial [Prosthecobacter sp.]